MSASLNSARAKVVARRHNPRMLAGSQPERGQSKFEAQRNFVA